MARKDERGFASMDPNRQREIASRGGHAAHAKGTAHEFTSEEARQAGRKGGQAVSRNREHMAAIGRKGGQTVSRDREHMAAIGREHGEPYSVPGGDADTAEQGYYPPQDDGLWTIDDEKIITLIVAD